MPHPTLFSCSTPARRRWSVRGQVQGVGFRPFVYRLACRHQLSGFIRNDSSGVTIEAQGAAEQLERFAQALLTQQPPLTTIDRITSHDITPTSDQSGFFILASGMGQTPSSTSVTVDTATCADCLAELQAPKDRRYGYGLINCTNCGPRYSIILRVPYDRVNTTMAHFRMCDSCRSQYTDPTDRRFHAQPIACHTCGPQLQLVNPQGHLIAADPIDGAVDRLARGRIVAIKGLGGFHLAVRSDDPQAVARLRRLKQRDAKPFAVMCATVAQAQRLVQLSDRAIEAMASPACPIVLAPRRTDAAIAVAVAPGNHRLGVMLPSTPIHHLLWARGRSRLGPLVMTSGNVSGGPLVIDNTDAVHQLGGLCDAILWHDRSIERCVDDSVFLDMDGDDLLPIRRARGYAPGGLALSQAAPTPGVCVGSDLKNTVAVVRDGWAIPSQHLGDLTHPMTLQRFKKTIADLCGLFGVEPQWIAHDLHPSYLSTGHGHELARRMGVPLIAVQHHHAHAAAVMAEHDTSGPVLAVVCDGVGYGTDAAPWGGELLVADLVGFTRWASLRPLVLPGGDAAARDTRRCALALLHQALGDDFEHHPETHRLVTDPVERRLLAAMIRRRIRCTPSTSAGRLFDAMAALLGLCATNTFEGQAAMALEACADGNRPDPIENQRLFSIHGGGAGPRQIDLSPLVRHVLTARCAGQPAGPLAALFHDQLAAAWDTVVAQAAGETGVRCVVLSGGVFCNQRLTCSLTDRLVRRGLRVMRHRLVPPNDGGLSLGQAAVAAARLAAAPTTTQFFSTPVLAARSYTQNAEHCQESQPCV